MANAKPLTQNQPPHPRSNLVRLIAIVLLTLIVLVGLIILIIWLTIKPKKLVYSIEDGAVHNYNLSNSHHLNATYYFILRAYNPNKKVSIYYDKVDIVVLYDDQTLSRGTIDPFHQPKRNATNFKLNLSSHDVTLPEQAARDMKVERSSGRIEMTVKLKARIRFKVGAWKSRHYRMKVTCAPIMVHYSSSAKGFERISCDVDI